MTLEEKEPELSEETIGFLKRAYNRPIAGRVLDTIARVQRQMEVSEEEEE